MNQKYPASLHPAGVSGLDRESATGARYSSDDGSSGRSAKDMIVTRDEDRRETQIHEQIKGQMFAALIHLDREIDRIMMENGLSWEEDEWLEERPDP